MTNMQIEAIETAVVGAFAHLTDAQVAQLVMEPYFELRESMLARVA